jgi:hypothetical protein
MSPGHDVFHGLNRIEGTPVVRSTQVTGLHDEKVPFMQGFGFCVQYPEPTMHTTQVPLLSQTSPEPQSAPAGSCMESLHVCTPDEQLVLPV